MYTTTTGDLTAAERDKRADEAYVERVNRHARTGVTTRPTGTVILPPGLRPKINQ